MQDLSKAFKFFSLAAEQGWVDGQLQLGIMYYCMSTVSSLFIVIIANCRPGGINDIEHRLVSSAGQLILSISH